VHFPNTIALYKLSCHGQAVEYQTRCYSVDGTTLAYSLASVNSCASITQAAYQRFRAKFSPAR